MNYRITWTCDLQLLSLVPSSKIQRTWQEGKKILQIKGLQKLEQRNETWNSVPSSAIELGTFSDRVEKIVRTAGGVPSLARKSGLSDAVIRKWLGGHSDPSRANLVKLADAAGVHIEWLATGRGPMMASDHQESCVREPLTAYNTSEFATVPFYDVEASCGHGAWNDEENIISTLAFRKDWLKAEGLDAAHLAVIRSRGDSMEPTIQSGDTLLIDLRVTSPRTDGIYIIEQDGGLSAKRIQRAPDGTLYIRSDNPAYREFVMSPDTPLNIIGRLVWFGRRTF